MATLAKSAEVRISGCRITICCLSSGREDGVREDPGGAGGGGLGGGDEVGFLLLPLPPEVI
eukprot:754971-Hanusia_phi.AAC.1